MDARERDILAAICREYIISGVGVGSRTLVKRAGMEQSPATVRNVMADLEERGLLIKPHTSAGRVPTDEGLRFFVDELMQSRELTEEEKGEIRRRYKLNSAQLDEVLREISRLLSDMSHQCGLVLVPRSESTQLKRIEFVPLRPGKMIAVLVMASGVVQNRLIDVDEEIGGAALDAIHNYLNGLCTGRELAEVRRLLVSELERDEVAADQVQRRALELGSSVLGAEPSEDTLVIAGRANLLDEAHDDPERIKVLLRAVEEKKTMLRLLDETIGAEGVKVFIGAETRDQGMAGVSMVAAAYGGDRPLGTLGVLGPSNMDYRRVLPLVDFTASVLTEILRG